MAWYYKKIYLKRGGSRKATVPTFKGCFHLYIYFCNLNVRVVSGLGYSYNLRAGIK